MDLKPYIAEVINNRDLSFEQARDAMDLIMSGSATQAQIGSYLTALRMKRETGDEIAGSAFSMRAHVIGVDVAGLAGGKVYDVVGTGGDGTHTFNVSTTTAFVVAGAGKVVAKHGNRGVSSRSGSADCLMALGGNLNLTAEQTTDVISEAGIGFLYAVKHHPAMRYAIGPRRELGQRTIFNILGPLTNPANATHYMLGVFAPEYTEPMAYTLGKLGATAAYVVHGASGLDELSITGVNRVSHLKDGVVTTFEQDPRSLGMELGALEDLIGGEPSDNAAITRGILSGEIQGHKRNIVLLNAAGALSVETGDWEAGLAEATQSIDSGAALAKLDAWIEMTNKV
ncbi:MAG: anthranilate phosphoribosyltransferase [Candidatus Promineifilaceae bacterium]